LSTEGEHAAAALAQLLDVLGRTVVHWPRGVAADAVNVMAIVDRTDQAAGAGLMNAGTNRHVAKRALLTLSSAVSVTAEEEPKNNSCFVFDGLTWQAEEIVTVEEGSQDVIVKHVSGVHTGRGRR